MLTTDPAGQGNPTQTSAGDPNPTPTPETVNISFPENWKEALDKDIKEDPSMAAINDIKALAKSYVHGQRMVGADKIVIPGKNATEGDWANVFKKLGLPDSHEKYETKAELQAEFLAGFKQQAHKLGILPSQFSGIAEFIKASYDADMKARDDKHLLNIDNEIKALKAEWGDKFEVNVSKAQKALKAFASPEEIQYIHDSGLSNDTRLVKIFSKIAEGISEDKFNFESESALGSDKASAQKKIDSIMSDVNSPYFNASHPNHEAIVNEMQMLHKIVHN